MFFPSAPVLPLLIALAAAQSRTSSSSTRRTTTSTIKWQASGGVSCPHPAVNTIWPSPTGSTSFPTASVIPANAVFDGKMAVFDRRGSAGDCKGQAEQDEAAAVFILEPGATLKNAIIGPAQAEGVHCRGPCNIENVWWEDVCEDAATFKGSGPRYVRGGGAREASDKVFQHNGEGWLHIDGFYANKFGKFYRSCGNCSQQFQRHVNITNFVGIQGVVMGVNQNYGDTGTLSNYCVAKIGVICTRYEGCVKPCEAGEIGEGALAPYCVVNGQDWS
ncbi:pectate lyase [Colletotrichum karsti]|uniref:Pectate lyase n=1 Tax=Colletotrichum karsti TaxID=1095194 RepID=A0A9P6HUB5_9PEZI|nr:pectate lyase [Colletotrichum karsti]KAF9870469.1 pectate lyase [Colletotrichum karsti]